MAECCAYCEKNAEKYSSGIPECWDCWYQRKLNMPAASHWQKATKEFLVNVDMYDLTQYFPACGLTRDEMNSMLKSLEKIFVHSESLLKRRVNLRKQGE